MNCYPLRNAHAERSTKNPISDMIMQRWDYIDIIALKEETFYAKGRNA